MRKSKIIQILKDNFGRIPKLEYKPGDMDGIKKYYEHRLNHDKDEFLIDDLTWNDLNMDDVYKRMNLGLSTSGEHYLYYTLRSPAINAETYRERQNLIDVVEEDEGLRRDLSVILYKLGRERVANICEVFKSNTSAPSKLALYLFLVLGLLTCLIAFSYTKMAIPPLIFFAIVNPLIRECMRKDIYKDVVTVNYAAAMVLAAYKISKINHSKLKEIIKPMIETVHKLKAIIRVGDVSITSGNDVLEILSSWLMVDLITYEYLKKKLAKNHDDIFLIHEYLGKVDTAIAVASFRRSVEDYSVPSIDFSSNTKSYLKAKGLRHPLVKDCVPNDLIMINSILVTGSNASGKSTYIKTVGINLLLSQSICTAIADDYTGTPLRLYSSMAIKDDLEAGESYYIAEIKSLKRIVEASKDHRNILCIIDEILRGTNTIERIAASSEVLKTLAKRSVLCLAATHDLELCQLLSQYYRQVHFQEEILAGEMLFDYKLREGPTTSRNAIKLLSIMGFEDAIIQQADNRAKVYMEEGKWQ